MSSRDHFLSESPNITLVGKEHKILDSEYVAWKFHL